MFAFILSVLGGSATYSLAESVELDKKFDWREGFFTQEGTTVLRTTDGMVLIGHSAGKFSPPVTFNEGETIAKNGDRLTTAGRTIRVANRKDNFITDRATNSGLRILVVNGTREYDITDFLAASQGSTVVCSGQSGRFGTSFLRNTGSGRFSAVVFDGTAKTELADVGKVNVITGFGTGNQVFGGASGTASEPSVETSASHGRWAPAFKPVVWDKQVTVLPQPSGPEWQSCVPEFESRGRIFGTRRWNVLPADPDDKMEFFREAIVWDAGRAKNLEDLCRGLPADVMIWKALGADATGNLVVVLGSQQEPKRAFLAFLRSD